MSSERLEQGIALSKAREIAQARELFAQLIAADVHNETAWVPVCLLGPAHDS